MTGPRGSTTIKVHNKEKRRGVKKISSGVFIFSIKMDGGEAGDSAENVVEYRTERGG